MSSRPRSDIGINLPALKKLDAMLLVRTESCRVDKSATSSFLLFLFIHINYTFMMQDILDSFEETEFWYIEQGSISGNSTRSGSGSFRRIIPAPQRKEEKWWLPVPCVPSSGGLTEQSRKHLRHKRDCTNQIHKAAKALNNSILAEMDIPDSYMLSLPKVSY